MWTAYAGEMVLLLHWSLLNYAAVVKILKKHGESSLQADNRTCSYQSIRNARLREPGHECKPPDYNLYRKHKGLPLVCIF